MEKIRMTIKAMITVIADIATIITKIRGLTMRQKILLIIIMALIFATLLSLVSGCSSVSGAYVRANYKSASVMLPDLIAYIQADRKLRKIDKEVRIKAAKGWLRLNKTYMDRLRGK